MNCLAVRDRLPEHALGSLLARDDVAIERHLQWCAACRKESGELQRAAATFAFALAPAEPAAELEARVVERIRDISGTRAAPARRGRLAVAAVIAAMVAISGLGWGAVMAGRAARSETEAKNARQQQLTAVERFRAAIAHFDFAEGELSLGELASPRGGTAGGAVVTMSSSTFDDVALVLVSSFRPSTRLPLEVRLVRSDGRQLEVARIWHLDAAGSATRAREFGTDVSSFDRVVVRDARGRVVLRGTVFTQASLASPSP